MKVTIGRLSFLSYLCLAVVLPSLSQTPARDAATEASIEIEASAAQSLQALGHDRGRLNSEQPLKKIA